MDTILQFYFLQTNPKSRLFQNVKKVPTIGIPEIGHIQRFVEFHKYGIFHPFSNFVNSKNRHFFQNFRFVYFQEYFLFLKCTDFWNSNSRDYLVSIPISGIPIIWELLVYQYLAMRVKCQIVPQYLEILNFCHWVCFCSKLCSASIHHNSIYNVFSLELETKPKPNSKSIPFTRISLNFSLN